MATIATLTKQKDGGFLGTLSTLALHAAKIAFVPVEKPTEKGPVYRALLGDSEIGAGWKRTSKAGNTYISVKLDDPSFARPIYCVLVKSEQGGYALQWDRQTPKKSGSQNSNASEF
jgi:uncharacterized protein (DUF736 family)